MNKWFSSIGLFVACLLVIGCGGRESDRGDGTPENSNDDKITIALLPKLKGIAYFTSCAEGAQQAADELDNVELIYNGPTTASADKQAQMIDKWRLQGVDVIAVAANDPAVLSESLKKAQDAGITVITWDADAQAEDRSFFVNQATAEAIGSGMVDTMANDLGGPDAAGDVAIISATATAANQNEWMKHMKTRLASYPNLNLVATKFPGEDQNAAFQDSQDLIKKYPNLKGIFGISSVSFPGAAEAVKQAGKTGEILVTGLSTPNDMQPYVKGGEVKTVVLWNTQDLGYLTVYAAAAIRSGELKQGATEFTAGRLGKKLISGDQIMLGDILLFTKENIDQFDF
ncbi:MAG: substrate-binding domain-containing protein [Rubripirellula sp.]|nr:substrate-binding domain-containing protein [Planctomycetaceae bacterium]MDF1843637.1 substrate-binding domain-containing protein [Rubripirellula sp.]